MNFENNFLEKCPVGDTRSIFNKQKKKVFLIQLIRGNFVQSLRQDTALNSISKKATTRVITAQNKLQAASTTLSMC